MDDATDPDTLALLLVQQYLDEHGYMSGEHIGFCSKFVLVPRPVENPNIANAAQHSKNSSASRGFGMCQISCQKAPCCLR